MTGIQALERIAPDIPMKPGRVLRREYEYIRHGTQCLIAAFDIANGSVKGTLSDRRTEEDLSAFVETLITSQSPQTKWEIVADNLNTHLSEGLVRLVARHCDIDIELGKKGKKGILKTGSRVSNSCATKAIALPFTLPQSTHPGSIRSKSGFQFWSERSFVGVIFLPART